MVIKLLKALGRQIILLRRDLVTSKEDVAGLREDIATLRRELVGRSTAEEPPEGMDCPRGK